MTTQNEAMPQRNSAHWFALVLTFALRRSLLWSATLLVVTFVLLCATQISLRDAHYTLAHYRAAKSVDLGQPNATHAIRDESGQRHRVTAFSIVTHPGVVHVSSRTYRKLKLYSWLSLLPAGLTFAYLFISTLRRVRR